MNDENQSPRRGMARARSKRTGRSKSLTVSRPIMIGVALILAAAAFLFWPRGGGNPTGIGERMSVVTADNGGETGTLGGEPRSGEVTIENETSSLVPESVKKSQSTGTTGTDGKTSGTGTSGSQATSQPGRTAPADSEQKSAQTATKPATTTTKTATTKTATSEAGTAKKPSATTTTPRSAQQKPDPIPQSTIQPSDSGGWAIQVGAFGKEDNAQKNIKDLRSRGYPAIMHAASAPGGDLLYKVWIGYFKNREEAATYAREHRRQIGEAIPVHR